jgi:hypothetical protein
VVKHSRAAWVALGLWACSPLQAVVLEARGPGTDADVEVDDGGSGAEPSEEDAAGGAENLTADAQAEDAFAPDASAIGTDASVEDTQGICRIGGASDGFYETFGTADLDPGRWLVAHGAPKVGETPIAGGFLRDNVALDQGTLVLRVRGSKYAGDLRGFSDNGAISSDVLQSGAAVATRDLFGSGTYQVEGRISAPTGITLALWWMRDDPAEGGIDVRTPDEVAAAQSYTHVQLRTRDGAGETRLSEDAGVALDDGARHILRFDWYTTGQNSVRFWIDDVARSLVRTHLPGTRAGRLWIAAYTEMGATADFDTAEVRIDNAFVTPFGNLGDECVDGELRGPSLVLP